MRLLTALADKSSKKLAPKTQVRRRPGAAAAPSSQPATPALSATSARTSVDPQPALNPPSDDHQAVEDESLISRAGNDTSQAARDAIEASLARRALQDAGSQSADAGQATAGATRDDIQQEREKAQLEKDGQASSAPVVVEEAAEARTAQAQEAQRKQGTGDRQDVLVITVAGPSSDGSSRLEQPHVQQQLIDATNQADRGDVGPAMADVHGVAANLDTDAAARLREANASALEAASPTNDSATQPESSTPATTAAGKRKRQPAKTAANKRAKTTQTPRAPDGEQAASTETLAPDVDVTQSIEEPPPEEQPTKKPRKVRKDKGIPRKKKVDQAQTQEQQADGDEVETPATPELRRSSRISQSETAARETEDATGGETNEEDEGATQEPEEQRRKRRKRKGTPEENENKEIDPRKSLMAEFCHDKRIGKISDRERDMRQINWADVRKRRKEERTAPLPGEEAPPGEADANGENADGDEQADADAEPAEEEPQPIRRRTRIVNGVATVVEAAMEVDRHAEADREREHQEVVEQNDLTRRITSHTWIDANRRDENERKYGRPKSEPWTVDLTKEFYDALRMWGTDFNIISKIFPGKTRRHIKLKFVREEHENPDLIKRALIGERVPMDLERYKKATGITEFKDPDTVREEMAETERVRQEEIVAAREEWEAEERQRKAMEGEDGVAGESAKENAGPGGTKKKGKKDARKKKGKEVAALAPVAAPAVDGNANEDAAGGLSDD